MRMCKRYKAKGTFGASASDETNAFFHTGNIMIETYPGSGIIRREDTPFNDSGIDIQSFIDHKCKDKYLEDYDPIPFKDTDGYKYYKKLLSDELEYTKDKITSLYEREKEITSFLEE